MVAGIDFATLAGGIADLGVDLAGTARTKATLHLGQVQAGDYNFDTDKTEVGTVAGGGDVEVEGLKYRTKQQQAAATGDDAVFLVKGKDAPNGITEADSLTIEGVKWNITLVEEVPTKAIWLLYIRR